MSRFGRSLQSALRDLEYVYGHSSVLAALHAQKRQDIKRLYLQEVSSAGGLHSTKKKDSTLLDAIVDTCRQNKIPIVHTNKGELNNMTQDRPHQGVVLEASPRTPIELKAPNLSDRSEFWIALDEVQDPQNLGSILRTAHFFGVDGVVLCSKNSAPLTPTVSKVSAGAMEVMDIYSTHSMVNFLKNAANSGWHLLAATAPEKTSADMFQIVLPPDRPRMLVLGNEGQGLRTNVKRVCHQTVSIPAPDRENYKGFVDSLNVGVATGILVSYLTRQRM
ncbi:Alpha/beta knot methyltransferase [Dichotomocladium elegans]|nr:Alpha/beta knot methyltransferase [Dichotomocladium elegans]